MSNLQKYLVNIKSSALDAIKSITENGTQFAIVVDDSMKLMGVITDGDIRQGILKGIDTKGPVNNIMNSNPKHLVKGYSQSELIKLLAKHQINHLPITDGEKRVLDIYVSNEFPKLKERLNPVVIMAGGLGSRLGDLTSNTPKPLLKIGDKPILEIILENFIEYGFNNFYISVNYMSDQIESYFKNGTDWGVNISYIRETVKLGTAGSLSLMDFDSQLPIVIMNGDLLTKVNFAEFLESHNSANAEATMCVRKYEFQVPYGVIQTDGKTIAEIIEKPVHSFFVNAGIYVLNPSLLKYIEKNQYMDMTTLFEKAKSDTKKLSVFPIHEYWLDIGRIEDFEKAQLDFYKIFK